MNRPNSFNSCWVLFYTQDSCQRILAKLLTAKFYPELQNKTQLSTETQRLLTAYDLDPFDGWNW